MIDAGAANVLLVGKLALFFVVFVSVYFAFSWVKCIYQAFMSRLSFFVALFVAAFAVYAANGRDKEFRVLLRLYNVYVDGAVSYLYALCTELMSWTHKAIYQ